MSTRSRFEVILTVREHTTAGVAAICGVIHDIVTDHPGCGVPSDVKLLGRMVGLNSDDVEIVGEAIDLLKTHRFLVCEGSRLMLWSELTSEVTAKKARAKDAPAPTKNKTPRIALSEHVMMTEEQRDRWENELGSRDFLRCVEKLEAWIGQDPTPKRIKNGYNADCTFRSWVVRSVLGEAKKAPQFTQKSNVSRAIMELLGDD